MFKQVSDTRKTARRHEDLQQHSAPGKCNFRGREGGETKAVAIVKNKVAHNITHFLSFLFRPEPSAMVSRRPGAAPLADLEGPDP